MNVKTPLSGLRSKRLRAATLVFAAFLVLDLVVYGVFIAPSAAVLATGEAKYNELRRRHAEAILFRNQKSAFAGIMSGIPAKLFFPVMTLFMSFLRVGAA